MGVLFLELSVFNFQVCVFSVPLNSASNGEVGLLRVNSQQAYSRSLLLHITAMNKHAIAILIPQGRSGLRSNFSINTKAPRSLVLADCIVSCGTKFTIDT